MLPDVLGYECEQGKQKLLERGFTNIFIVHTKSPFKHEDTNDCSERIIRTRYINSSSVELLVCRVST